MLTGFIFSARIKRVCIYHSGWCVYPTRAGQHLCPERGVVPHPERGVLPHPERGVLPHPERGVVPHLERGLSQHPERGLPVHLERGVLRTPNGVYYCTLNGIYRSPQPLRKTDLPSAPRFTRVLLSAKLAANGKSIPSVKSLFYRSP